MKFLSLMLFVVFASLNVKAQEGRGCFLGHFIPDGSSVIAYQNSTVPYGNLCVSETRTCTNGVLSGSFNFDSCSVDAPASCLFNGQTIINGGSVTAYQNSTVPYGNQCISETRTCFNGSFDGTFQFASCSVAAPAACIFNGQTIPSGQSVTTYPESTVPYGHACTAHTELCTNGVLSGNDPYASCTVAEPASCLFNGQTIAHGQTVVTYAHSTVPYGQTCEPVIETCNNGALSGNNQFASCTVGNPAPCDFNGQSIPSEHSVIAYQAASVPYGSQCVSQTRMCHNGVLNGSFAFNNCSVQPAPPTDFIPSTKAEKLAYIAYMSCGIPNKSFPRSYSPKQPSLQQILEKVQACTPEAYPETSLNPIEALTINQLIDPKNPYMRNKFFSCLWYQPPYTDHFETYFGIYSPDILNVLCYGASSKKALEGFDQTTEYVKACLATDYVTCWNWEQDKAAQARWNSVQKIRSQLRKCIAP